MDQLLDSARHNQEDVVKRLISEGVDINSQNAHGKTALMVATEHLAYDVCSVLVGLGADLDIQDENGWTALMLTIVGYGFICDDEGPTHYPTDVSLNIAKLLIEAGADLNRQSLQGETALIMAATYNFREIGLALIRAGADLNIQDGTGKTALLASQIHYGHNSLTIDLIQAGADVNIEGSGITPLRYAIRSAINIFLVDELIRAGADVTNVLRCMSEYTSNVYLPVLIRAGMVLDGSMLFSVIGKRDQVGLYHLIDGGVDVNVQDPSGNTPLMRAINNLDMVRALLQAGASIRTRNNDGRTALSFAWGNHNLIGMLTRELIQRRVNLLCCVRYGSGDSMIAVIGQFPQGVLRHVVDLVY